MARGGGHNRILWTALSIAGSIILMLVSTWAVNVTLKIDKLTDRQRDLSIRLRSLENQFDRDLGRRSPTGEKDP